MPLSLNHPNLWGILRVFPLVHPIPLGLPSWAWRRSDADTSGSLPVHPPRRTLPDQVWHLTGQHAPPSPPHLPLVQIALSPNETSHPPYQHKPSPHGKARGSLQLRLLISLPPPPLQYPEIRDLFLPAQLPPSPDPESLGTFQTTFPKRPHFLCHVSRDPQIAPRKAHNSSSERWVDNVHTTDHNSCKSH